MSNVTQDCLTPSESLLTRLWEGQRRPNTAQDLGWESELPPSILVTAIRWFSICTLMVRQLRECSGSALGGQKVRMGFRSFGIISAGWPLLTPRTQRQRHPLQWAVVIFLWVVSREMFRMASFRQILIKLPSVKDALEQDRGAEANHDKHGPHSWLEKETGFYGVGHLFLIQI